MIVCFVLFSTVKAFSLKQTESEDSAENSLDDEYFGQETESNSREILPREVVKKEKDSPKINSNLSFTNFLMS